MTTFASPARGGTAGNRHRPRLAELRRPLGVAIIGGLLVSQVLTLYTTPIIYLLLDKLHRRPRDRRAQRRGTAGEGGCPLLSLACLFAGCRPDFKRRSAGWPKP